jgi:hypothetical protein
MDSGTKVVGARADDDAPPPAEPPAAPRQASGDRTPEARTRALLVALSAAGIVGTLVFGLLWAGSSAGQPNAAVLNASRTFLSDLTNFNAKSVDSDFSSVTAMATGSFATQAKRFFNSEIRTDLEKALAESRGQIRGVYIQSNNGSQASVYGVVDQVYVNNKITTPQADVLRILVDLQLVGSTWKISNVTVLEGATPASAGSPSGSAGSSVPGQ